MSGIIDDVTSVFSDVFGDGGGDAVDDAATAASAADDASDIGSAANEVSDAETLTGTENFVQNAASEGTDISATSGDAISDYMNNAGAAAYTSGVATGDFGTSSTYGYMDPNPYGTINDGEFNPAEYNGLDGSTPVYTNLGLLNATDGSTQANGGFFSNAWNSVSNFLTGGSSSTTGTTGGGMSDLSKLMLGQMVGGLVSGSIQAFGAYKASQPKPPQNFSGRTPGGGGGGLGMSTNGFGLTAGGSTPPPTGVPSALIPNAQSESLGGSGGLASVTPPNGAPNIQQTVANQAGFGGLIPQGSVNYMKGGGSNG